MGNDRSGCLRIGCFGCIGCALLAFGLVAIIAAAWLIAGPPERNVEDIDRVHRVPERFAPSGVRGPFGAPGEPPSPHEPRLPADAQRPSAGVGTVRLDVGLARLEVVPGEPGEPIRLEGRYDEGRFDLEETLVENEDGWTYELSFRSRFSWLRMINTTGDDNFIRLVLPRDVPFRLEGEIGIGESQLELGGLSLTSVQLDVATGEHNVRFSEPLPRPMEHLGIDGSIGELHVLEIGNASPATTVLDHEIGEVVVDLGGDWSRDGRVDLTAGIGDCRVRLPDDVHVDVERRSVTIGESNDTALRRLRPAPDGAPTVTISAKMRIGELLFQ